MRLEHEGRRKKSQNQLHISQSNQQNERMPALSLPGQKNLIQETNETNEYERRKKKWRKNLKNNFQGRHGKI